MYRQHDNNVGYFVEKEFKYEFTYRKTTNEWALGYGFEYEFDVGYSTEVRFCNVKKTRAYIVVEEDETGLPVVQTWVLSKHVVF